MKQDFTYEGQVGGVAVKVVLPYSGNNAETLKVDEPSRIITDKFNVFGPGLRNKVAGPYREAFDMLVSDAMLALKCKVTGEDSPPWI